MLDHLEACSSFSYLSVDTEGFVPTPLGLSIAHPGLRGMYFPFNHKDVENVDNEIRSRLFQLLTQIPYRVFHHAGHDITVLPYLFDVALDSFVKLPFICTMIMGHMVDENLMSKSLDYMHKVHCGGEGKVDDPLMQSIIKTMGWEWVPFELINKYAEKDAVITMELFMTLKSKYEEQFGPIWTS